MSWDPPRFFDFGLLHTPDGQTQVAAYVTSIRRHFPCVTHLDLAIDGRDPDSDGYTEIAEPTCDYEDFYVEAARKEALAWIPGAMLLLRDNSLQGIQADLRLILLVNELQPFMERRWDYCNACCHLYPLDFTGHRSESESESSRSSMDPVAPSEDTGAGS